MGLRIAFSGIAVVLLGVGLLGWSGDGDGPAPVAVDGAGRDGASSRRVATDAGAGSAGPRLRVVGGSPGQRERLQLAQERFRAVGLRLPDLEVVFSPDAEACGGHHGLFSASGTRWTITICSDVDSVYEHELAHAWLRSELDGRARRDFVEAGGYPAWSGDGVPWNRRGGEQAAIAIQTGIAGLPLPPALGRTHVRRLEDFETLTGRPAPRLAEWLAARRVACPDRPTPLSGRIPDAAGSTCPGTSGEAAAMPWTGQPAHDSTTLSPMAAEPRWWEVRSARNPSGAFYRCPFCDGPVHAATEHLLVVPEGDAARRRHAHTECAREARERGELPLREDVRPEGGFLRRWFRRRG